MNSVLKGVATREIVRDIITMKANTISVLKDTEQCCACDKTIERNKHVRVMVPKDTPECVLCRKCSQQHMAVCPLCGVRCIKRSTRAFHRVTTKCRAVHTSFIEDYGIGRNADVCATCHQNIIKFKFSVCRNCGRYHLQNNTNTQKEIPKHLYHPVSKKVFSCHDVIHNNLSQIGQYCSDCNRRHYGLDENYIITHPTDGWGYDPPVLFFHNVNQADKGPFYGIEIESEVVGNRGYREYSESLTKHFWPICNMSDNQKIDFWMKPDGSLNNGIEFCFHPRSIQSWQNYMDNYWSKMTEVFRQYDIQSSNFSSTGLHIHREKEGILPITSRVFLVKFCNVNFHNKNKLETLFGRKANSYCTWSRLVHLDIARNAGRTLDIEQMRKAFLTLAKGHYTANGRGAVCFGPPTSMEYRLPKGTLKHNEILGRIEGLDLLINFTHKITVKELCESISKRTLWHDFIDFVAAFRQSHPHVVKLLDNHKLIPVKMKDMFVVPKQMKQLKLMEEAKHGNPATIKSKPTTKVIGEKEEICV